MTPNAASNAEVANEKERNGRNGRPVKRRRRFDERGNFEEGTEEEEETGQKEKKEQEKEEKAPREEEEMKLRDEDVGVVAVGVGVKVAFVVREEVGVRGEVKEGGGVVEVALVVQVDVATRRNHQEGERGYIIFTP